MKQYSEPEALNKAAAYCTLTERCTGEVNAKLIAWGIESAARQRIIKRLTEEKFIDDKRYCQSFVNDKMRFNHWGRIKIRAKLIEKRLPRELIADALENIDEEEYNNVLRTLIANKAKEVSTDEERKRREKLLRFAASRGFEPSIIMKQMNFYPDEMDF